MELTEAVAMATVLDALKRNLGTSIVENGLSVWFKGCVVLNTSWQEDNSRGWLFLLCPPGGFHGDIEFVTVETITQHLV